VRVIKKFNEAKGVWDRLQAQFDDAVKRRPEYGAIRKQLDVSEREYKDANAELEAARKAAKPIEIVQLGGVACPTATEP